MAILIFPALFLTMLFATFLRDGCGMQQATAMSIALIPWFIWFAYMSINIYKNVSKWMRRNTKIPPYWIPLATVATIVGVMLGTLLAAFAVAIAASVAISVIGGFINKMTKEE